MPKFGLRNLIEFPIWEGSSSQAVCVRGEIQHAPEQNAFGSMRSDVGVADSGELSIFRADNPYS